MKLHQLTTGRESYVGTAIIMLKQMLFIYQGYNSADLVLGGFEVPWVMLLWLYSKVIGQKIWRLINILFYLFIY